jgi:hypothetical protein
VPIYALCFVTIARARPSRPVSVKAALAEGDRSPAIIRRGLHLLERVRLCSRGGVAGLVGDISAGRVGLRTWSRPYIGRRWR